MSRPSGPFSTIALAVLAVAVLAGGCTTNRSETASASSDPSSVPPSSSAADATESDYLRSIPEEARVSNGGGDPRPPAYWMVWNACAPENRADEAEANGGRAAGWLLVDDVLADPGLQLGEHLLISCEEAVALLGGAMSSGAETGDPIYALAAQLLAAELNFSAGAETCPAAEEATVAAHIVLAAASFDGASNSPLDNEAAGALPRIVELLTAYNSGVLCR